jgi:hypothetical protein
LASRRRKVLPWKEYIAESRLASIDFHQKGTTIWKGQTMEDRMAKKGEAKQKKKDKTKAKKKKKK